MPREKLVQQAIAGLATGFLLVDPRGRIAWLNRAAERLLGLSPELCIGRAYREVIKDPQLAAFWEQAECQGGNCQGNISLRFPRPLELKVNATRCLSPAGKEIGRALLFCDVTSDRNVKVELTQELAGRLRDLAGDVGAPPKAFAKLTPRELRALRGVGRGLTNEAVAAELGIAVSTLRCYLKSAYRKLGIKSRAQVVRFAVQHRLA